MSHKRFKADQLWQFLCPALSTPRCHVVTFPVTRRRYASSAHLDTISKCLRRPYSSTSEQCSYNQSQQTQGNFHLDGGAEDLFNNNKPAETRSKNDLVKPKTLQRAPISIERASTEHLENQLAKIVEVKPNLTIATQILRVLIRDRGIRPETRHYKALIQSHSDPRYGSPFMVQKLLSEMEETGVSIDAGTLHAALRALAVHPSFILRPDLLRTLRDRWLPLSPDGWHYVVAGLIREHQFELALDHIAHMERKFIEVKPWIHSMLIYYLCDVKEFDQIIELMESRLSQGYQMSKNLWCHVLAEAASAHHRDLARFIWKRFVEVNNTPPRPHLSDLVLRMASHTGDKELIKSITNILGHNIDDEAKDYEMMSKARVKSGELVAAFQSLCDMQNAGHDVVSRSTQAIRAHCVQNKIHPRNVWNILKELKNDGEKIPFACARVVVYLCTAAAVDDPFAVDDGIAFYKELNTLCDGHPDIATFNSLIGMCRVGKNAESAMFMVKEMAALGVIPDAQTFEHLMLMCVETGNFESSYLYLKDLRARGFHLSDIARLDIQSLCAKSSDEFAVKLRADPGLTPQGAMSPQEKARREYNKQRRKKKRRMAAIQRSQEEDNWETYEPSLSAPQELLGKANQILRDAMETRRE